MLEPAIEVRRNPRKIPARRILLRIAGWTIIVILMLRWFEHRQVYHPSRTLEADGRGLGRVVEEVYFEAADGVELHAWFFPSQPDSPRSGYVWLLCHGNAGNISHRLSHAAALLNTGAAVFLFDYRGYGRSRGRPSEAGTYLDAQAAHRWLGGRGYEGPRILVLGESLGGAIGAELALRERVGGLVLLATFTSVPDLGAELFPWLPVRSLCAIEYRTVEKLPQLKVPVMVVHSPEDSLVRISHAEANYAAIRGAKLFWTIGGDHNDFLEEDAARYAEGLTRFMELVTVSQPAL
jgi:pimeloyl-ACP methyl ester carboxylesterase